MPSLNDCKKLISTCSNALSSEGGIKHAIAYEALSLAIKKVLDEATAHDALLILSDYKNDKHQDIRCVLCQISVLAAISSCKSMSKTVIDGAMVLGSDLIIAGTTTATEAVLEIVEAIADVLIGVSGAADFGISELILPEAILAEEAADVAIGAAEAETENIILKLVRSVVSKLVKEVEDGAERYLLGKNIAHSLCAHLSCCKNNTPFGAVEILKATQRIIDCTPNQSITDLHAMFWLKGWDAWVQVTLNLLFKELPQVEQCQRTPQKPSQNNQSAVDYILCHGNTQSKITLICESIFDAPGTVTTAKDKFALHVTQTIAHQEKTADQNFILAIACTPEASMSMKSITSHNNWQENIIKNSDDSVGFYIRKL